MRFADIPGHAEAKARLIQMADSGRMPHALLIEGPSGIGKLSLARAYAQYIDCEHPERGVDSCGVCASCRQHGGFNQIDTIYSYPVVKKDKLKISDDYAEEFRSMLKEMLFMDFEQWLMKLDNINAQPLIYVDEANELLRKLNYTSHSSKYKKVILWLPERLKEDAANKLLKLIEEPYDGTLFILVSDNSRRILPTIYSRTQRLVVRRYDDDYIAGYLSGTYGVDEASARDLARQAQGNMAAAVKLMDVNKDTDLYLDLFIQLMRKAYTRKVGELKEWAAELAALGREREMRFWDYCSHMVRENFMLNLREPELTVLNTDEAAFSSKFSPFINTRNVERLVTMIDEARQDIAANANAKLVNFDVALQTILLLKQ